MKNKNIAKAFPVKKKKMLVRFVLKHGSWFKLDHSWSLAG